jgi:hypothetical protein
MISKSALRRKIIESITPDLESIKLGIITPNDCAQQVVENLYKVMNDLNPAQRFGSIAETMLNPEKINFRPKNSNQTNYDKIVEKAMRL